MPIPSSRSKLLPLRGLKVNLDAGLAEILEGEMCYATDEDVYYQKEGGVLVKIGGGLRPGDNVSELVNDAGYITLAEVPDDAPVDSVNGQVGVVVLDADDIDDTSTAHKFASAAELELIGTAIQPGDNVSDLVNDAGYITLADIPSSEGTLDGGDFDTGLASSSSAATLDGGIFG